MYCLFLPFLRRFWGFYSNSIVTQSIEFFFDSFWDVLEGFYCWVMVLNTANSPNLKEGRRNGCSFMCLLHARSSSNTDLLWTIYSINDQTSIKYAPQKMYTLKEKVTLCQFSFGIIFLLCAYFFKGIHKVYVSSYSSISRGGAGIDSSCNLLLKAKSFCYFAFCWKSRFHLVNEVFFTVFYFKWLQVGNLDHLTFYSCIKIFKNQQYRQKSSFFYQI